MKVFGNHPQFDSIPLTALVCKRLAQCLNPALPSGVHSKALEVYSLIFNTIGVSGRVFSLDFLDQPQNLIRDLPLYAIGLFPLLKYSAMTVKPVLLSLYRDNIIVLGTALKPSLKALITSLLYGLEEEGNEFFNLVIDSIFLTVGGCGGSLFIEMKVIDALIVDDIVGSVVVGCDMA